MTSLFKRHGPVLFRAALYFLAAFLAEVVDQVTGLLKVDTWPSPQRCVQAGLTGLLLGIIALRAFYDGTAERAKTTITLK